MAHKKKSKQIKRRAAPSTPKPFVPPKEAPQGVTTPVRPLPRTPQAKGPDVATEFRYVRGDLLRLAIVAGAIFLAFGALYLVVR